jgi:hypothetical protein
MPCTRRRKQTRASYFVAVYGFRGETPTLIFTTISDEAARRCIGLPPLLAVRCLLLSLTVREASPLSQERSFTSLPPSLATANVERSAYAPTLLLDTMFNLHRMTPYQPSRDFLSTTSSPIFQFPARAFPINSESLEFPPFPLLKSTTRSGRKMTAQSVRVREKISRTRWIASSRRKRRRKIR